MTICEYCRPIFLEQHLTTWTDDYELLSVRTARPLLDLFEGKWACRLCEVFRRDLESAQHLMFRNYDLYFERGAFGKLGGSCASADILEIFALQSGCEHSRQGLAQYRVFTDMEGPLSSLIKDRLVERDGTSEAALARMNDLVRAHVNMDVESVLPTRVLDVQGSSIQDVRLCEPGARHSRYAALSHCWGTSDQFTTTRDNRLERLNSIGIAQMPKTFQDAINVTRRLGLPYLWIDSLCIVQHDLDDWEAESSRMSDYYGNATITIAAANSSADAEGFLRQRSVARVDWSGSYGHTKTIYADECSIFELEDENQTRRLYMKHVSCFSWGSLNSDPDPVDQQPLQRRAWTLQERYLSNHVLHFGQEQNYLESHESGLIFYEDGQWARNDYYWLKLHDPKATSPFQNWYAMTSNISGRGITDQSDIFPALSGLAQRVSSQANEKYVAGLWEGDLLRGLLWVVSDPEDSSTRGQYESENYRAPSWSWASSNQSIKFLVKDFERESTIDRICKPLITYAKVETQPLGCDPFGRLRSASLHLTAPILKIDKMWAKDPEIWVTDSHWRVSLLTPDSNTHLAYAYLDRSPDSQDFEGIDKFAVFLSHGMGAARKKSYKTKCSFGIIVYRLKSEDDVYKRIGAFQNGPGLSYEPESTTNSPIPEQSLKEIDRRTITII